MFPRCDDRWNFGQNPFRFPERYFLDFIGKCKEQYSERLQCLKHDFRLESPDTPLMHSPADDDYTLWKLDGLPAATRLLQHQAFVFTPSDDPGDKPNFIDSVFKLN